MSASKNMTTFLGAIQFGSFQEKALTVNTWSKSVYVHIKDRARGKFLSFRANDFMNLLKLKSQVLSPGP